MYLLTYGETNLKKKLKSGYTANLMLLNVVKITLKNHFSWLCHIYKMNCYFKLSEIGQLQHKTQR